MTEEPQGGPSKKAKKESEESDVSSSSSDDDDDDDDKNRCVTRSKSLTHGPYRFLKICGVGQLSVFDTVANPRLALVARFRSRSG